MSFKSLPVALLAAFITLAVYLPVLQNGFVNWDDHLYVYENEDIRSLDVNFLKQTLTSTFFNNWHPLTMISYALDYAIWGLNPAGYHLTNILFHAANTLLVFVLVVTLIECKPNSPIPLFIKEGVMGRYSFSLIAGFVTALLFGIHPMHVESVAWVSERKDVLYAFFYLLSILAYLKYTSGGCKKATYYGLCLFLFFLSLMSKAMAVTLPAVLLILDFYPLARLTGKALKGAIIEKIPFFALSIMASLVAVWAQGDAVIPIAKLPIMARPIIAMDAFMFYIWKMLLPFNLTPFYPYPEGMTPGNYAAMGVFIAITACCLYLLKGNRVYLSIWLYYLVALLPVIGLVQVGAHFAADRYVYLSAVGPFFLISLGIGYAVERCFKKQYLSMIAALTVLCCILIYQTIKQTGIWHNSITLWSHQIKLHPATPLGYNNRGHAHMVKGEYVQAINDFEKAIELNPLHLDANYNLGVTYGKLGRLNDAIKQHLTAIKLRPDNPAYHSSLGSIYFKQMRLDEAMLEYKTAIRLKPDAPSYHNDLANTYYKQGRLDDAIQEYQTAIRLKPDFVYPYYNLGRVYLAKGLRDKAGDAFEAALRIRPDFLPARQELALIGD